MASFPALDLTWRSGIEASPLEALHERLHAVLDEFAPQAIHDHEAADGWRVFFRSAPQRDAAAEALRTLADPDLLVISSVDVADDEWARRSQANLSPITVGKIVVTPPWHPEADRVAHPEAHRNDNARVIVIDPSTGFGTGHHETTRLCLRLLQDLDLTGCRVIDVGTGSGVLAIAAAVLGATDVTGFDEDPEALRNARENVATNGVTARVVIQETTLATFDGQSAAVVVANITAAVLEKHAARLAELVESGGVLIASGFSPSEADGVASAFGLTLERRSSEGDWAAVLFRSPA